MFVRYSLLFAAGVLTAWLALSCLGCGSHFKPSEGTGPVHVADGPPQPTVEEERVPEAVVGNVSTAAPHPVPQPRAVFPGEAWVEPEGPDEARRAEPEPKPNPAPPPPFTSVATNSDQFWHGATVFWARFNKSGGELISATRDGLYRWDVQKRTLVEHMAWDGFNPGWLHAVSVDLTTYVTNDGAGHGVLVIDLATGQLRYALRGFPGLIQQLVLSSDGKLLGTCLGSVAYVWSLADGKLVQAVMCERRIHQLHVGADVRAISSSNWGSDYVVDPRLMRWSLESGDLLSDVEIKRTLQDPQFTKDGSEVVSWINPEPLIDRGTPTVQLFDFRTGASRPPVQAQPLPTLGTGEEVLLAVDPNQNLLLLQKRPERVEIWDLATATIKAALKAAGQSECLSPDGKILASIHGQQVYLWGVETAKLLMEPRIRTLLRPVVVEIAPEDPFRIALHWEQPQRDNPPRRRPWWFQLAPPFGQQMSEGDTLGSLTFHVRSPSNRKYDLRAKFAADPKDGVSHSPQLADQPTFVFTLSKDGVATIGQFQRFSGEWSGDEIPDFAERGVYRVSISGRLIVANAGPIPFESGEAQVRRGNTVRLAVVEEKARERLKELLRARPSPAPTRTDQNRPARLSKVAQGTRQAGIDDCNIFSSANVPLGVFDNDIAQRLVLFTVHGENWTADDYMVTVHPDGTVLKVDTWSRHTCIAEGTVVDTPGGQTLVQDVRVGNMVWSYDVERRTLVQTQVRSIVPSLATEIVILNDKLHVTTSHPIFASRIWKPAGKVVEGDLLLDRQKKAVIASPALRRESKPVRVFDLTVDDPHNFFAGGILVHNKSVGYPPGYFDPWKAFSFQVPENAHRIWKSDRVSENR